MGTTSRAHAGRARKSSATSAPLGNARIALDTDQLRQVELRWLDGLLCAQVLRDHVPDRVALRALGDRRPARHLVRLAGVDRHALQAHVRDALPHRRTRRAGVREAAYANHVTALLVVRIGVEEVVADVLEDG